MRVFYEYEDEQEQEQELKQDQKRRVYVKLYNMSEELREWKAFEVTTTADLLTKIAEHYTFDKHPELTIQLWSSPSPTGKRLDNLKEIPEDSEFLWVKVLINNRDTQ